MLLGERLQRGVDGARRNALAFELLDLRLGNLGADLAKVALSVAESLIASPPPSMIAFFPGTSSPSQAWPTCCSTPVTDLITAACKSGGSFFQKSSFMARPKLDTYEYISVEYFRMPPILKAMPAPP